MFYLTDNPFKGKVPDDKVKRYWDMFGTKSSMKAAWERRLLYAKAHITTQKEKPMDAIFKMTVLE